MNAPAFTRRRPGFNPPSLATEIASALAGDFMFFKHNPERGYRIRKASPAEICIVQRIERRLLKPTEGIVPVVLVRMTQEGYRRRVVIEAYELDIEALNDNEVQALYLDVVSGGSTWIEGRSA